MDKYGHKEYMNIIFSDNQIEMFANELKNKKDCLDIFKIIFKYTAKNPLGITKDTIIKEHKYTTYKCSIALEYLSGATLIYYNLLENQVGKYICLTSRGCQVYDYLKKGGFLND